MAEQEKITLTLDNKVEEEVKEEVKEEIPESELVSVEDTKL